MATVYIKKPRVGSVAGCVTIPATLLFPSVARPSLNHTRLLLPKAFANGFVIFYLASQAFAEQANGPRREL
ncbi:MAG: hypothetical protein WAR24_09500 [Candidatus Acidiferrales bacterium]